MSSLFFCRTPQRSVKRYCLITVATPLVLIANAVHAAPNEKYDTTQRIAELETIVVTATRSEKSLSDSPIRTEVVTLEELKKTNAVTLKDAIENVAGAQLREIHGKSGYEVSLQGLSSDQVLVLINGLPLASSTSSTVDLSQYLIGEIDHIEIVKGATSAQYGSSAMGGVINVISKKIDKGVQARAQIDGGSYGRQNDSGRQFDFNNQHQSMSIEAAGDVLSGRLSYDGIKNNGFGIDSDQYVRQGDRVDREQFAGFAAWQPNDQIKAWVDLSRYLENDQQRSLNFSPPFYLQQLKKEEIERDRYSSGVKFQLLDKIDIDLKGVHETYDTTSVTSVSEQTTARRRSKQVNNHISSQIDFPTWHQQQWQLGFDWHEESLEQYKNGKPELTNSDISRDRSEIYLQNDINISPKLQAVLGYRYQDDADFGGKSVFKASGKYRLYEDDDYMSDLRLSYGQGYRVPNLKERFYYFDHANLGYMVLGNPNLQAESSDSYQVGIDLTNLNWKAELNLFLNDIDDLIQYDYSGVQDNITLYSYSNVAHAQTYGSELSGQWHVHPNLKLNAGYTYTKTKDKTTDNALTRRPEHMARLGADAYFSDELLLTVRTRYQSQEYTDSDNNNQSPSWFSLDAQLNYDLTPNLAAFVGIDNLFDTQRNFDDSADYRPISGRYSYAGLRFNWQKY